MLDVGRFRGRAGVEVLHAVDNFGLKLVRIEETTCREFRHTVHTILEMHRQL